MYTKTNTKLIDEDGSHVILTIEGENMSDWNYKHSKAMRKLKDIGYEKAISQNSES